MDVGKLNRRIVIEQQADGQDDTGSPNGAWSTLATEWANIRYGSGAEAIRGGAIASTVMASIRISRRTDVTTAMRVREVDLGTLFNILAVLPDETRRAMMDLACEVVT